MLLVLGDTHLRSRGSRADAAAGADLARLVRIHPSAHLVLAGDVFDLAFEGSGPLTARLDAVAGHHEAAMEALADHVRGGGRLTWIAGNHDHEIASAAGRAWAAARLGAEVEPWFARIGDVHVEHGHQFDPDNAHADPMSPGADPLGVLLTRRFVSRAKDSFWLGAAERTPLPLLASAFARAGIAAPALVLRWFETALGAVRAAGPSHAPPPPSGDRLRALHARPTLASRRATWSRLYFDRVVLSLGVAGVGTLGVANVIPSLAAAIAVGLGLALGLAAGNRFEGSVESRLAAGASAVARETGARVVVFGHAHRVAAGPLYWNAGSFGIPGKGRPRTYLVVESGLPRLAEIPIGRE